MDISISNSSTDLIDIKVEEEGDVMKGNEALDTIDKICKGIPVDPLPEFQERDESIIHAPFRNHGLNDSEKTIDLSEKYLYGDKLYPVDTLGDTKQAIRNALRYFPHDTHDILHAEFEMELERYGHIYMYRFKPRISLRAYPIDHYPANLVDAKAIMLMIMNNLDPIVAQYPDELVTYGSNGQVFSNWAQFLLTMKYLAQMKEGQSLILSSGHPVGLFPISTNPVYDSAPSGNSSFDSKSQLSSNMVALPSSYPRLVITNGMMIPNFSKVEDYEKYFALGITQYGQMTAGSFCYIGPQGIVHGTVITLANVARKYTGSSELGGKVFVSSGLGGMSGAQSKAATIVGCIGVIAEVNLDAILKRYNQGWLDKYTDDVLSLINEIRSLKKQNSSISIAYHGNVVDLWHALCNDYKQTGEKLVDFGSDQTSLHNPYAGGYYPADLTVEESNQMIRNQPETFKLKVFESLRKHVNFVNELVEKTGMIFWDYGNAFLAESAVAGANIYVVGDKQSKLKFRYPSYVESIMGDVFSLGFGPFRWICSSGKDEDLIKTDAIAIGILEGLLNEHLKHNPNDPKCTKNTTDSKDIYLDRRASHPHRGHIHRDSIDFSEYLSRVRQLYEDNLKWMKHISSKPIDYLTVGSRARILYSDCKGRIELALAFNKHVANGYLSAPVIISRDHHDVSGADSPYRETSDIYDGSNVCADMVVQNVIGNAMRGSTWVAIHNGGGVGWGRSMNNGFGLVLHGKQDSIEEARIRDQLGWDVLNGLARRCWTKSHLDETEYGDLVVYDSSKYAVECLMRENPMLNITIPYL